MTFWGQPISCSSATRLKDPDAPRRRLDALRRQKGQQIRGCGRSGRSRPEKQFSRIGIYVERVDARCVLCVHPLI
jgi:hypothetical protein